MLIRSANSRNDKFLPRPARDTCASQSHGIRMTCQAVASCRAVEQRRRMAKAGSRLDRCPCGACQRCLRKTSWIAESSAASLKGLMSTVAFTRRKKNSIARLFR